MGIPLARVEAPFSRHHSTRRAGVYDIGLAGGVSEMDRDFVLARNRLPAPAPTAALFTEIVAGEHYGLLLVVPRLPTAPRRQCRARSFSWWTPPVPWAGCPYARGSQQP